MKSYLLTSEIVTVFKTLVDRYSTKSSVSFEYKTWCLCLKKSEQLVDSYSRLITKLVTNCFCQPHWRKVGCLSEDVISIFATILKGEM